MWQHISKLDVFKFLGLGSAAFVADLATSTIVYYVTGWPLFLCGMLGFLAGAAVAYFIYLFVTFSERGLEFSWITLWRFLKVSFVAAILRAVALSLFDWFTNLYGFVTFFLAIAVSSGARYLLARFYVFRKVAPNISDDLLESFPSDKEIR